MPSRNRFWLSVHQLAQDFLEEGSTASQQTSAVIEEFRGMPPIAQRELLADLAPLALHLSAIYTTARAIHSEQQSKKADQCLPERSR